MKYLFIQSHRSEFRVEKLCQSLKIHRSGFYHWRQHGRSELALANEILLGQINEAFDNSRQTYGSPRITKALRKQGIPCGKNRVARLMKINGIEAKHRRRFKHRSSVCADSQAFPNLVNREFHVAEPNRIWALDITYLPAAWGWLYFVAIMDLYSRRIVGWEVSTRLLAGFVLQALKKAFQDRSPKSGLIVHSDRGSQFSSALVTGFLKEQNALQSMSRKGDCYDNSVIESFFGMLKNELLDQKPFESVREARIRLFDLIDIFYNRSRIHSTVNYMSPVEFETTTPI
jgi:transposase InsO family protein